MSINIYDGPEFGSPGWIKHWSRRAKNDIMSFCVTPMVRKIQELTNRVDALEWTREVAEYDIYNDHPLCHNRLGRAQTDAESEQYRIAREEYGWLADDAELCVRMLRPGWRAQQSNARRLARMAGALQAPYSAENNVTSEE